MSEEANWFTDPRTGKPRYAIPIYGASICDTKAITAVHVPPVGAYPLRMADVPNGGSESADKSLVVGRYPDATLKEELDVRAYHRWLILPFRGSAFCVGGGPTEAEAWRNAAVHLRGLMREEARRGVQSPTPTEPRS